MTTPGTGQFLAGERQRLVGYVRQLLRTRVDIDPEDIVQDVIVKLLVRSDSGVTLEHLAGYTYQALRNRVIDVNRGHSAPSYPLDDVPEDLASVLQSTGTNGAEWLERTELRERLFEALDTLADIERRVVVGHELEGHSFREMSDEWNVPQNTLLSHKRRGLQKLKQLLIETKGVTS